MVHALNIAITKLPLSAMTSDCLSSSAEANERPNAGMTGQKYRKEGAISFFNDPSRLIRRSSPPPLREGCLKISP